MPHKSYRLGTLCALDYLSSQHKEVSMRFSDENTTIYESQRDRDIAVSPSLLGMDEAEGKYTGGYGERPELLSVFIRALLK